MTGGREAVDARRRQLEGTGRRGTGHVVGRRRRPLPSGRAVVGGFLVAASATGAFAMATAGDTRPATSYVVVVDDIPAGERLGRSNLDLVALDLPAGQRRTSFEHTDDLLGAVTLGPMAAGQLVHVSDVARPTGAPERAQISIPVDAGRALNGRLRSGELIDVIATFTDGGSVRTETVSAGAVIVEVSDHGDTLAGGGRVVITLAVLPDELERLTEAAVVADIFLARVTGVDRGH